jgi:hypothetical protein
MVLALLKRNLDAPNRTEAALSGARLTHFEVYHHDATSLMEVKKLAGISFFLE